MTGGKRDKSANAYGKGRQMINRLGGRKFLMSMGCGVTCSFLLWFGKISGDVFQWVVLGTVGAYVAGNVAQKKVTGSQE